MIEYHADDYGLFPKQSCRILESIRNGNCSGISIMPNSACLEECMEMLSETDSAAGIRISVHLNLVEGTALSDPGQVSRLADQDGTFRTSFGKLLIGSMLPGRGMLRKQIETEFAAQMRRCRPYLGDGGIRLDSHTHIHMIPMVFEAMIHAAGQEGFRIEKIRIPREEWSAYRTGGRKLAGKKPVNCIKALVLNACAAWNVKRHASEAWSIRIPVFAGVLCSGRMDADVLELVVPKLALMAHKRGVDLEVLFHPGGVFEPEDLSRITFPADRVFLSSPDRNTELEALMGIRNPKDGSREDGLPSEADRETAGGG